MEDKGNAGVAVAEVKSAGIAAKKPTKAKFKARGDKSAHPSTAEMVNAAILELKDRKGSSLQAIKKYVATTYKVDDQKVAPFIKRYLKSAVTSGAVVQTKGKGASGSFKLSAGKRSVGGKTRTTMTRPAKKATPKKARSVEIVSKKVAPSKKSAVTKKPLAEKKAAAPRKVAAKAATARLRAATEAKNMSRAKKAVKAPAAKTRTPKPKKARTAQKSAKSLPKK